VPPHFPSPVVDAHARVRCMRIIYFDIDCLRPDHLGCYGYSRPTSPAIDAIAAEGVRFEHYYCGSSPCLPSRTALTSGRFGIRNGIVSNRGEGARFHMPMTWHHFPRRDSMMFPRHLRQLGYETICFSNFADRHYAMWFTNGWSEFHTPNLKCGWESAAEVNEKLLPWLRTNATRENYYLHINYWDTHREYRMGAEWADRFRDFPVTQAWPDDDAIARHQAHTGPFTAHRQFRDDTSTVPLMPGAIGNRADFEKMVTAYDASIAYVDAHIAQVLEELDRQRVLEDSVIIFSSDHGDAFGEHGIYSDHVCADECIHRVPLIVRWPGVTPANHRDASFLYNVDYAPTICDLLGSTEIPAGWDGSSFRANVEGRQGLDRDYLVWDTGLYSVQRAVRTRQHLYLRTYDPYEFNCFEPVELYDMCVDPYQACNVANQFPEVVAACERKMAEWVEEQHAKGDAIPDPIAEVLRERGRLPWTGAAAEPSRV
jgi:choline-sulfatase